MKRVRIWTVEYEGPDGDTARVLFTWRPAGTGTWKVVPIAVEFDLFTPPLIAKELTEMLLSGNLTGSLSVSAFEPGRAEPASLPWE